MSEKIPDAAALLANVGELPEDTRSIHGAAPDAGPGAAPAAAPATIPHDPMVDLDGERFDVSKHEADRNGNPQRRSDGRWRKKRGNGSRKAKGLGLLNLFGIKSADQPANDQPAGPVPAESSASFLASPGASPGASGQVVPGVVEIDTAAAARPIEAYDSTAASLTYGQFAVLQLLFGSAWESAKDENQKWQEAWRRVLHHYQLPVVGPLLELSILAVTTIAKRSGDAETRSRIGGLWRWLRGGQFRQPVRDDHEVKE